MSKNKNGLSRTLSIGALALVFGAGIEADALEGPGGPVSAPPAPAVADVSARVETSPVPHKGDAADDPAIWVNPQDPSLSAVIGSDKLGGIGVYDLDGREIQYLRAGKINNVDLRTGFTLGGREVVVVAGSNRTDNSIALFTLDPKTRTLTDVAARKISSTPQSYGACLYHSKATGKFYCFVTAKTGVVEQYELFEAAGKIDARKVRSFNLGSVAEGCVADDELGQLYVSQELVGIWKLGAEPEAGETRKLVDKAGKGALVADVEGLAIAYGKDGKGYLMVSSQGNHTYVVYRREGDNAFVKTFRIVDANGVDGAAETDGIDVTTASLGDAFPRGLFVAQDGFNDNGNQNFKLVPLERIVSLED